MMLESALNAGITPIEIKEILYQAVAYAGMAKVMDFVGITNEAVSYTHLAGQWSLLPFRS